MTRKARSVCMPELALKSPVPARTQHYAESVASVLEAGGALHLLCFSDEEPPRPGPRQVSGAEIQATFDAPRFEVTSLRKTRFVTRTPDGGAVAWLAKVTRL